MNFLLKLKNCVKKKFFPDFFQKISDFQDFPWSSNNFFDFPDRVKTLIDN